ncbi:MAG: prepilin-type N-terminal cleavage/methylation domain-containing protein [Myxococcota bacterium]
MPRPEAPRIRSQAGFTLLEVMIAFTILSIGLLSIGVGQLSALRLTSTSRNAQQAMYLAEELMETFRALPWSAPPPWGPTFFTTAVVDQTDANNAAIPGNPHAPLGPANPDTTSYRRSWTIAPNQPPHGLTEITVTVSWTNANGVERTAVLQSIKGP